MAFHLRRADPKDAAELSRLIYLSKQSNGYDDAFMEACAEELRVTPDDIKKHAVWVAEADHLLGCITLETEPGTNIGQISSFFVHPDHKRQGIGKALWARALQTALAADLTKLSLDADPEAVPFYAAMGFVTVGQNPSGSIPGRYLPVMERDLVAS